MVPASNRRAGVVAPAPACTRVDTPRPPPGVTVIVHSCKLLLCWFLLIYKSAVVGGGAVLGDCRASVGNAAERPPLFPLAPGTAGGFCSIGCWPVAWPGSPEPSAELRLSRSRGSAGCRAGGGHVSGQSCHYSPLFPPSQPLLRYLGLLPPRDVPRAWCQAASAPARARRWQLWPSFPAGWVPRAG